MPDLLHTGHDVVATAGSDVADVAHLSQKWSIPSGSPFRVTIDQADAVAAVINMTGDRVWAALFRRIGRKDLLKPHEAA